MTMAKRAFAARNQADEVEACRIGDGTEFDNRAVAQNGFQSEQVIDGRAVFDRIRSAGVCGHVAADRTGALRGRFGRKEVTRAGQRFCKLRIVNARLDHGPAVAEIDIQHAIHSREHEHNAASGRQASACQAGARPARHDRYAVMITDFYHGGDLPGRLRKYDRLGRIASRA